MADNICAHTNDWILIMWNVKCKSISILVHCWFLKATTFFGSHFILHRIDPVMCIACVRVQCTVCMFTVYGMLILPKVFHYLNISLVVVRLLFAILLLKLLFKLGAIVPFWGAPLYFWILRIFKDFAFGFDFDVIFSSPTNKWQTFAQPSYLLKSTLRIDCSFVIERNYLMFLKFRFLSRWLSLWLSSIEQ